MPDPAIPHFGQGAFIYHSVDLKCALARSGRASISKVQRGLLRNRLNVIRMFKGQGQTGLMCELVIFTLVCLWFGDHSSALPIGKAVKFNPTDKEVENVTLEDCKVRSSQ